MGTEHWVTWPAAQISLFLDLCVAPVFSVFHARGKLDYGQLVFLQKVGVHDAHDL